VLAIVPYVVEGACPALSSLPFLREDPLGAYGHMHGVKGLNVEERKVITIRNYAKEPGEKS
jgi:hypothetical protein